MKSTIEEIIWRKTRCQAIRFTNHATDNIVSRIVLNLIESDIRNRRDVQLALEETYHEEH